MTGTLAEMELLVVLLAAALCAAVPLGLPEIEQDFNSPFQDSGSSSEDDDRIIDGEPACRDQFRHHARIVGDEQVSWGGSLIKPTAILTDAMVVGYKKFTIRLGTIFREGDDSAVTVQSIWALVHPEFNTGEHLNNNLAVILLNVEVPLGKSIWPVKLPSFDEVDKTFTGRRALITGFGQVNATDDTVNQERLRFAEVTVISNDLCKRFYNEGYIIDGTLCAGNSKTGFCYGDHGGPLVIKTGGRYKQIGIASWMGESDNCGKDVPAVYTRVTAVLDWIQRAAGDLDDWGADQDSYFH